MTTPGMQNTARAEFTRGINHYPRIKQRIRANLNLCANVAPRAYHHSSANDGVPGDHRMRADGRVRRNRRRCIHYRSRVDTRRWPLYRMKKSRYLCHVGVRIASDDAWKGCRFLILYTKNNRASACAG